MFNLPLFDRFFRFFTDFFCNRIHTFFSFYFFLFFWTLKIGGCRQTLGTPQVFLNGHFLEVLDVFDVLKKVVGLTRWKKVKKRVFWKKRVFFGSTFQWRDRRLKITFFHFWKVLIFINGSAYLFFTDPLLSKPVQKPFGSLFKTAFLTPFWRLFDGLSLNASDSYLVCNQYIHYLSESGQKVAKNGHFWGFLGPPKIGFRVIFMVLVKISTCPDPDPKSRFWPKPSKRAKSGFFDRARTRFLYPANLLISVLHGLNLMPEIGGFLSTFYPFWSFLAILTQNPGVWPEFGYLG